MSHFHPTQHASDNDFQMWQQQMMYKQLQEYQRQQQLQQPDHGARMQPSFGQFHAPAKPLPDDQFSTVSNEMLNNEAASFALPQIFVSRDPSLTSNAPMLNNGSTNWDQLSGGMGNFVNGSNFTNAQSQPMRPMGLATHQMDQSFYSMHGASSRGSGNQYSQFLGIPVDSQSAMARVVPDQSEKTSRPFNSSMNEHNLHVRGTSSLMQSFGKGSFLNNSQMESQGDHIKAGSTVTINHLQLGFQAQDYHGRPNQVDFQVGVQEKPMVQAGSASGRASLDPTEEKILFGNDEDSNWGALLRGDDDHGSSLNNDNLGGAGAYSSLHSGSWSALMQEALQSTTSEKNSPKEQWSSLSFQRNEHAITNISSGRDDNKLAELSGRSIEDGPLPTSGYGDRTINNPNFANFQHTIRTPYERRDQMPHESPSSTVKNNQSTSEVNNGYFPQSLKQNQSDRRQEHLHLANGMWAHQKPELLRNNSHSTGTHASPPREHRFWMSQQNPANETINRDTSNNKNDWKPNNAHGQDINNSPNVFNSWETSWKSSGGNVNSVQRLQQMKSDISAAQMPNESSDDKNMNMVGSSMAMMTQDHYQVMIGRTGEQVGMNHNMGHRIPETSESPGNSTDQRSSECNQECLNANSDARQTHLFNHGQPTTSDSAAKRHTFAGKEAHDFGQSGQQTTGSYMSQNRAMGSSGMNLSNSPSNPVSNSLFPPQSHQMQNNLQHCFGTNSHGSNNTPSVNEKMLMAQDQLQYRHGLPSSSSAFGGSDAGLSQNRAVQNSQHMLQLLHKVDNSRNNSAAADMSNNSFGIVSAHQQPNQPIMQGFGLRLAPPSQRQSSSGHLWSSQTNADVKQSDHSAHEDDHDRTQLPSTSRQSMTPPHPNLQSSSFRSSETNNTGHPNRRFPQLSSGQQYPAAEARSGPASMLMQPQQGSSATVFKNVWTNISAQRQAGMQANKITPNILQSMMFPNNTGASNLWNSQKTDDQGKKAATPPDVATSSANPQSQDIKQAVDSDFGLASSQKATFESAGAIAPGGNRSLPKPSSDVNYTNPVSSFAQMRQQGIMSTKQGESPGANFQATNASHSTTHNNGNMVLHGSPAPSNVQQQNYSLLHQIQAMGHTDIDPDNAVGKMTNPEIGSDASADDWKSGQRFTRGPINSTKLSTDNIGSPGVTGSFPSDMKMLSFASRSEERDSSIPSQLPPGERQSHAMVTAQNDHQNQVQPINMTPIPNSVEQSERPRLNPQMAPSWFGHHGSYKNGQSLVMLNSQKTTPLPYNFPKASWDIDNNSSEHRIESRQPVRPGHLPPSTKVDALVSSDIKATSMMKMPKKRKSMESAFVSWHKVIEGPQKMRNISTCEVDWAWEANRLTEKDEALDDGPLNYLPRKRLTLTTRLIQQLLPAIPATILRAEAVSAYESAAYTLSMLTMMDACSMASSSLYNSCSPADDENNQCEQTMSAKKMEEKLSKAAEIFIGRIQKMENDLTSLNKRASMLGVQLECQDLERISIVNRLGRFHARNHAAAVEGSSGSAMISRRIFPERLVMSFAVPGNLPEGAYCLSL